jgi:hypothetical protein
VGKRKRRMTLAAGQADPQISPNPGTDCLGPWGSVMEPPWKTALADADHGKSAEMRMRFIR